MNSTFLSLAALNKQLKPEVDSHKITIFISKKKVEYLQLNFVPPNGPFWTYLRDCRQHAA